MAEVPSQTIDSGTDATPSPEESRKPRRRGRPPKDDQATKDASVDAGQTGKPADPEEAPKPRRRGRPRKAETAAADGAVAADEPKRPRRRTTRRDATEQASESDGVSAERPEAARDAAEAPMSVEDMTKATQAATKASAVPLGAPAATLAEADAISGQQQPAAQQGQGRRRRRNDGNVQGQQGGGASGGQQNGRRGNQGYRRGRRNQQEQSVEPSLTREELAVMKVAELRAKAAELGVSSAGVRKKDLANAIYEAAALAEGFRPVSGILEMQNEGYGFLRTGNYMSGDNDGFVHQQVIRQYGLRAGDRITGSLAPSRSGNKYPPLHHIDTVNGRPPEEMRRRPRFRDLTPIYPNQRLVMEHGQDSITGRAIDLVAPIGKGQRGLIVSPPRRARPRCSSASASRSRPTTPRCTSSACSSTSDPRRSPTWSTPFAVVVASTFDMPADNHTKVSELVIEHAKRLVELGRTSWWSSTPSRASRAYNLAQPLRRILSGGVDSAALYPPQKFWCRPEHRERRLAHDPRLRAGRHRLEDGRGHLRGVQGTGNMELKLDRDLADKRIFPAIDPVASGTRNEDLLIDAELQPFVWGIRRVLANMNSIERAANALVKGLRSTKDNQEFLIRSARKAQQAEVMM